MEELKLIFRLLERGMELVTDLAVVSAPSLPKYS